MFPAMVIAILTAITAWWLLVQRLREKPWMKQGVVPTSQETVFSSAPKIGLWVFLAVVSSLFGLFSSAYVMRLHDAHGEITSWAPIVKPSLLWLNTTVLVLASGAMQIARNRVDRDDFGGVRVYFSVAGVLTVLFLAGPVLARRRQARGRHAQQTSHERAALHDVLALAAADLARPVRLVIVDLRGKDGEL